MYKLNILYTSLVRVQEQKAKWDQNLVNANFEI